MKTRHSRNWYCNSGQMQMKSIRGVLNLTDIILRYNMIWINEHSTVERKEHWPRLKSDENEKQDDKNCFWMNYDAKVKKGSWMNQWRLRICQIFKRTVNFKSHVLFYNILQNQEAHLVHIGCTLRDSFIMHSNVMHDVKVFRKFYK